MAALARPWRGFSGGANRDDTSIIVVRSDVRSELLYYLVSGSFDRGRSYSTIALPD